MTNHVCDFQPEAKSGIRLCADPTCRKAERKSPLASGGQHSSGEAHPAWLDVDGVANLFARVIDPEAFGPAKTLLSREFEAMGYGDREARRKRAETTARKLIDCYPLYASPVPAQDDDKLREAIGHMSWMRNFVPCVFDVTEDRLNEIDDFISQEEAALKSTAAQEGGE